MVWILLAVFAGITGGSYGLPMKFTTKWKWENMWSTWSIWTLLILPWAIAFWVVPNLLQVYSNTSWVVLFLVFLLGFIWGIGAVAFGMGMYYLGLGLGYSLMVGLIITGGSLFPLIFMHPENILKPSGIAIIMGVFVIIIGVIFNAWSAVLKEKDLADKADKSIHKEVVVKKSFLKGLIICLVVGATAPAMNYALIYGERIRSIAENLGASKALAVSAVWAIALTGGFLVNLGYCVWLINKNKSWNQFKIKGTGIYFFYTLIMGILWITAVSSFGMAAANLGKLGPSIGWALCQTVGILWANILGLVMGEWKGTQKKTIIVMAVGLVILLSGVCMIAMASSL